MSGFPPVDAGELRSLAGWLGNASNELLSLGSSIDGSTSGVAAMHAAWHGAAHDMWMSEGSQAATDLFAGSQGLSSASQALSTLAGRIEQARQRFDSAQGRAADAGFRAFTGELRKLDPIEALIPGQSHRIQQEIDQAHADQQAAQGDANAAVDDALAAGRAASGLLAAATGAAAGVGRFGHGRGAPAPGGGGGPAPSPVFLTLLFGSVVGDNRTAGRAFQDEVLQRLGIPENHQTFREPLPNGRVVPNKPDAVEQGDQMWEIKSGTSLVYNGSQIQGEMAAARANGETYTLVLGRNTPVTKPLLEQIRTQGGEVVRYDPQTKQFTDRVGRPIERAGTGWRYPNPNEAAEAKSTGDGLLQRPVEPGQPVPEGPVAPEEPVPVEPVEPETPEIPELPFLP